MTPVDGRCSPVRTAVKVGLFCAIMLFYFLLALLFLALRQVNVCGTTDNAQIQSCRSVSMALLLLPKGENYYNYIFRGSCDAPVVLYNKFVTLSDLGVCVCVRLCVYYMYIYIYIFCWVPLTDRYHMILLGLQYDVHHCITKTKNILYLNLCI